MCAMVHQLDLQDKREWTEIEIEPERLSNARAKTHYPNMNQKAYHTCNQHTNWQ